MEVTYEWYTQNVAHTSRQEEKLSAWHPYPRYFVIPDRSWRGVAFIDDPLDQDGAYVGERDGSFQSGQGGTPDWRDHDEMDRNLYSDGVHRVPEYQMDTSILDEPRSAGDLHWSRPPKKRRAA